MKNGTSEKSSRRGRPPKNRLQIPDESTNVEFAAPIIDSNIKAALPKDYLSADALEQKVQQLADGEYIETPETSTPQEVDTYIPNRTFVLDKAEDKTGYNINDLVQKMNEMQREIKALRGGTDVDGSLRKHLNEFHEKWALAKGETYSKDNYPMIEVSSEVFDYYTKGQKTQPTSLWYQGVRVFKEGTMETILLDESSSVDFKLGLTGVRSNPIKFLGRT